MHKLILFSKASLNPMYGYTKVFCKVFTSIMTCFMFEVLSLIMFCNVRLFKSLPLNHYQASSTKMKLLAIISISIFLLLGIFLYNLSIFINIWNTIFKYSNIICMLINSHDFNMNINIWRKIFEYSFWHWITLTP